MLKLLHITPYYAPAWCYGGLVEAAHHLTRHLAMAGAEVRVLTTDANGPARLSADEYAQIPAQQNLEVIYCRRRAAKAAAPAMLARLPALFRWADVIHLHGAYSFPTIPAILCASIIDRPLVWSPHGAFQRWTGSRRQALKRGWELICNAVSNKRLILHMTSAEEARECAGRIAAASILVVPNGVEIPDRIERVPHGEKLRLGFIGRLDPKKGLERLLDVFSEPALRIPERFALSIAGSGEPEYERRISRRVAELRTRAIDISMAGVVRDAAKERWFAECDVVVMPSFTENFGIVAAEALARGVPVIASRATPWSEMERVGCGLWVPNDAASLADAISQIATMPLEEMGARGREWMISRYSWKACAAEMMTHYARLVGGESAVAAAQIAQPD